MVLSEISQRKMRSGGVAAIAMTALIATPLRADFSYTEKMQVTGGSLQSVMKIAGAFSKQAREANGVIVSTVSIKGNRMARVSAQQMEIIDLDKEMVTDIDLAKKQYQVMTFAQMRQQMEAAMAKAQQQPKGGTESGNAQAPDIKFEVHVRNTGAAKQVAGLSSQEAILTMAMNATDKKSGQAGSFAITNDMWMVPEIPGYDEVREFYRKYAEKMGRVFNAQFNPAMMAQYRGAGEGMAELVKEMSKLKGVPVQQVTRIGMTTDGKPLPAASEAALPETRGPEMPSAGEIARQSAAAAIASRLGGFGGLGGFGAKKKKAEAPAEPAAGGPPTQATQAVLIETTTEVTGFSRTAEEANFAVPAGYRRTEFKEIE